MTITSARHRVIGEVLGSRLKKTVRHAVVQIVGLRREDDARLVKSLLIDAVELPVGIAIGQKVTRRTGPSGPISTMIVAGGNTSIACRARATTQALAQRAANKATAKGISRAIDVSFDGSIKELNDDSLRPDRRLAMLRKQDSIMVKRMPQGGNPHTNPKRQQGIHRSVSVMFSKGANKTSLTLSEVARY